MFLKVFFTVASFFIISSSFALSRHEATDFERQRAFEKNIQLEKHKINFFTQSENILRPAADVTHYKYLLINSESLYNLDKSVFAKNLPEDMTLVVLAPTSSINSVKQYFLNFLPPERLIVVGHYSARDGFWARDAFPFPVIQKDLATGLVGHQYYRDFEGREAISSSVNFQMTPYDFVFVGGNLMANEFGDCYTIKGPRSFGTSLSTIQKAYGCKTISGLPHLAGIGDVDEVLKVLPNKKALTNQKEIAQILQEQGYEVQMLPQLRGYRTYANSLIVNGVVFMPSYKDSVNDTAAQKAYESYGYKVIPVDSRNISDNGHGSIHCITMAYPNINIESMLHSFGYRRN
jgi:Porphyromonas-type peptidyl-arginine deiminase